MESSKEFLKYLLCNCWSYFEILHKNVSLTLFKNYSSHFDPSRNVALVVEGGYLHNLNMKKFFKILFL